MTAVSVLIDGATRITWWTAVLALCAFLALCAAFGVWILLAGIPFLVLLLAWVLWQPRQMFFAWLFLGPTVAGLTAGLFGDLPALTPDRVVFLTVCTAAAARWALAVEPHPPLGLLEAGMAAFAGWALFSCYQVGGSGVEPSVRKDVIFVGQGYLMPFTAYLLARHFCRAEEGRRRLLYLILLTGTLVGLTGVIQFTTGVTWFNPSRHEAIRGERAGGTLASAVEYGLVVLNACACALALLLSRREDGRRLFLLVIAALLLAGIICSQTRSIWLGFLILLGGILLWDRRIWRPLAIGGVAVALAALILLPFLGDRLEAFQERATELGPIYNRIALSATAVEMALEKPLFGHGFAQHTFQDYKIAYVTTFFGVPTVAVEPRVPHNEWLHLWVLGGAVAVVLYTTIVVGLLRPLPRLLRVRDSAARALPMAAWAAALVFWANGLVVDLGIFPYASAQVFALLGAARAQADEGAGTGAGTGAWS